MRILRQIVFACFGLACLTGNALASYTAAPARSEPQRLRWKDNAIRLAISTSLTQQNSSIKAGSDVDGAVRRSIAEWQNAAGIEFITEATALRNVSPSGVAGDGISLLTIAASPENVLLFAKDPFAASARTRVFYNSRGFITEADIVLNPYQQFSTDGTFGTFDLEATLTHEIGHLLGLRHSSVMGAAMYEGLARNVGTAPITAWLSDSDIASARELYGLEDDNGTCCAAIAGRVTQSPQAKGRNLKVWAEDNATGMVAAQVETVSDGTFRLGGLPPGSYSVFWKHADNEESSRIGQLGTVRIAAGETKIINAKADFPKADLSLGFIGLTSQLADSAVTLSANREYTVYLGGKDLELGDLRIEFNSPYFRSIPGSVKKYDVGNDVSAVSFILTVDANVPQGVYSIFITSDTGIVGALIGGLRVSPSGR